MGAFTQILRSQWPVAVAQGAVPGTLPKEGVVAARSSQYALGRTDGALSGLTNREEMAKCLQVCQVFFTNLEKPLGAYLTELMHSDELRDLALYGSLKAWLYRFRQAVAAKEPMEGLRTLRSLLLLLLSAQVDLQALHQAADAKHYDADLRGLMRLLTHNWRFGGGGQGEDDMEEETEQNAGTLYYDEDY